jgi:hypothetical protein
MKNLSLSVVHSIFKGKTPSLGDVILSDTDPNTKYLVVGIVEQSKKVISVILKMFDK